MEPTVECRTFPELEEGEMICDKCQGRGHYETGPFTGSICGKCQGTGKVDWIENIVGKPISFMSGTSSGFVVTQKAMKAYVDLQV